MLVNGREIAGEVIDALKKERALLTFIPKVGLVVGSDDPVTRAYVSMKERVASQLGVEIVKNILAKDALTDQVIALVQELARHTDAVVVQLPLPPQVDVVRALSSIPRSCDVDALNPTIKEVDRLVYAPVAEAIREILAHMGVDARGKRAVVVGDGALVGAPAAALLRRLGAAVDVVTLEKGSLEKLKDADIVVLGAGSPGLVKPEMLQKGVVLIDAGTSEQNGKVAGDADPACADVASVFTPVPGGVGPLSIAMLFKNLFTLVKSSRTLEH